MSVLSFLCKLQTWHSQHLPLIALLGAIAAERRRLLQVRQLEIDRYHLSAVRSAANPQQRRATDGQTDAQLLHIPYAITVINYNKIYNGTGICFKTACITVFVLRCVACIVRTMS